MKIKNISLMLAMVILLTFAGGVFATGTNNHMVLVNQDVDDDMVLVNSEVFIVEDEEGNEHEVILEEYVHKDDLEEYKSKKDSKGIRLDSLIPEYEVGTRKTYVFRISNEALALGGTSVGVPLSSATKDKIVKILAKKLGEKIGKSILPGIAIAGWLASMIGGINAVLGNDGFEISITVEYSSTFIHSQGYYVYGWDLVDFDLSTY